MRDALTPNSGTTESVDYFIYESGQVVLQFHENNPTGNLTAGDLVHRYLWNPQQVDQLLADEQVSSLSSPGQVVWPLLNDQNSVTDLAIYEAGITAIAAHRVFGAYGNTASSSGSVGCAFGYTGKYSDPLTRLQYNTNRWYDPATCRWMSQDPLGLAAGPNVYRYAGDNPVNYTDPSGLFVITTGGSAGASSGGNPISIQGGGGGSAGAPSGGDPIMVQGATDGSSTLVEHELPGGGSVPLPNNGHIFHFTDGRTVVDYGNGNYGYLVVEERQADEVAEGDLLVQEGDVPGDVPHGGACYVSADPGQPVYRGDLQLKGCTGCHSIVASGSDVVRRADIPEYRRRLGILSVSTLVIIGVSVTGGVAAGALGPGAAAGGTAAAGGSGTAAAAAGGTFVVASDLTSLYFQRVALLGYMAQVAEGSPLWWAFFNRLQQVNAAITNFPR